LHHQQGVKALLRTKLLVFCGLAQVLAVSVGEARAHAAGRVAVVYEAVGSCPSEGEFKAAVESRGGNFTGPGAPGSAWAIRVSIAQDAGGYRGTLQTTNEDATSALREVHGSTCQDVVDALAVVSATALNPQAESSPKSSAERAPTPVIVKPPSPPAVDEGRLRATSSVVNAKVPVEAGTLRFDKARTLSLFAGAQLGMLPNTLVPRFDLSVSAANFVTTPGGKSYLDGPIPRLHVSYLAPATYHADDASSRAQGFLFALGMCWSPIYDTRGWSALLCGEYGAGWMQLKSKDAQGRQIQDKSVGLGFAGLGVETQYHVGSVFQLGLKLGTDIFVNQFGAERPDGSSIFRSSQFTGYGMLGFGVQY